MTRKVSTKLKVTVIKLNSGHLEYPENIPIMQFWSQRQCISRFQQPSLRRQREYGALLEVISYFSENLTRRESAPRTVGVARLGPKLPMYSGNISMVQFQFPSLNVDLKLEPKSSVTINREGQRIFEERHERLRASVSRPLIPQSLLGTDYQVDLRIPCEHPNAFQLQRSSETSGIDLHAGRAECSAVRVRRFGIPEISTYTSTGHSCNVGAIVDANHVIH
ncbi:hypothetical protein BDZ45DRAFT_754078 [Acephala macrosclerotiorum]|nr:hypothetical protein BDZ45DRAFT_754078 [Acephala macrosclerotiorum]